MRPSRPVPGITRLRLLVLTLLVCGGGFVLLKVLTLADR